MATVIRKQEFIGIGCLLQAIGFVAIFFFPFGTVCGIIFIVWGSIVSASFRCSECGVKLPDKGVFICMGCGARFEKKV